MNAKNNPTMLPAMLSINSEEVSSVARANHIDANGSDAPVIWTTTNRIADTAHPVA